MNKKIKMIFLLCACIALTGCSSRSKDLEKVGITYVTAPLNVPSIVEKHKGFFENNLKQKKVSVEYVNLTSGPEQTQALASGDVQILNAVSSSSVILSASNGADIKIIDIYGRSPKAYMLFTKDDSISNAKDLVGKKIAGSKGSTLYEMLMRYLKNAGLSENDIEFVELSIPKAQAALESGFVDAALLAGPTAYNTKKSGYNVLTTGEGLIDGLCLVATKGEFAEKYPEVIKLFLKSQKETLGYMNEKYDEVIKIVSDEIDFPVDSVEDMYPMYNFSSSVKKGDIDSLKRTQQFMLDNKMIESKIDIEELFLENNYK